MKKMILAGLFIGICILSGCGSKSVAKDSVFETNTGDQLKTIESLSGFLELSGKTKVSDYEEKFFTSPDTKIQYLSYLKAALAITPEELTSLKSLITKDYKSLGTDSEKEDAFTIFRNDGKTVTSGYCFSKTFDIQTLNASEKSAEYTQSVYLFLDEDKEAPMVYFVFTREKNELPETTSK